MEARLHGKRWSPWDDILVADQYRKTTVSALANVLGRTSGAVRARVRTLQLVFPRDMLFSKEDLMPAKSLPTRHQAAVELFMQLAGQQVPKVPTIPDEVTRLLRAKLLLEETLETINKGLGVAITCRQEDELHWSFTCQDEPNLVEIADGVADMIVVATGTALACGINPEPIQHLVDESNLAKFGPGSGKRDDGKWLKPPGWEPPKIETELQRQGWTRETVET